MLLTEERAASMAPNGAQVADPLATGIACVQGWCADMTGTAITGAGMMRTDHFFRDITFRYMMHTEGFSADSTLECAFRTGLLSAKGTGIH